MSTFPSAIPASLRAHVNAEPSSFARNLMARAQRGLVVTASAVVSKSRFAPMPQEPEDAKITGGTRSLDRRLLALNLPSVNLTGADLKDMERRAVKRVA